VIRSLWLTARVYVDPLVAVPRKVADRRWVIPLLWLALTCAASGAAFAARVDPAAQVIAQMEESGDLAKATDREVSEEVQKAERVALVGGVAKGVFGMPFVVLVLAVLVRLAVWLIGKKTTFSAVFTAVSVAMLPVALAYLLSAFSALRQDVVAPQQAGQLLVSSLSQVMHPASPVAMKLLSLVELFKLWTVLLLGLGLAEATRMRRISGLVFALTLYVLFSGFVSIGLPAMMQGGGGGPK
jgi:hypothetical protein